MSNPRTRDDPGWVAAVQAAVDAFPPLTVEQRDEVAAILARGQRQTDPLRREAS